MVCYVFEINFHAERKRHETTRPKQESTLKRDDYLLVAIPKKELGFDQSLHQILQIFSLYRRRLQIGRPIYF